MLLVVKFYGDIGQKMIVVAMEVRIPHQLYQKERVNIKVVSERHTGKLHAT